MRYFVIFSVLLLKVLCLPSNYQYIAVGITGGDDANITDYPYTLSLTNNGTHFCGAALIRPRFALTSALCLDGLSDNSTIAIRAGSTTHEGGQIVKVNKTFIPIQHETDGIDFDIAVLELEEEVTNPNASPVNLTYSGFVSPNGAVSTATGWGYKTNSGEPSDVLQKIDIPTLTDMLCGLPYGDLLTDRMMCAGFLADGGKNICNQDYGGPLIYGGQLVGIASWTQDCQGPGNPGVYAAIGNPIIHNFILRSIGEPY